MKADNQTPRTQPGFRHGLSLRSKFVIIVLAGVVIPLTLLGLWQNRTAERSGEQLLRNRLESSLSEIVEGVGLRWLGRRSQLLQVAESPSVQQALANVGGPFPEFGNPPGGLTDLYSDMEAEIGTVVIRDSRDQPIWSLGTDNDPSRTSLANPALPVELAIFEMGSGRRIGTMEARLPMPSVLPGSAVWAGVSGSVLSVRDPTTGASLLALSIDPGLLDRDRFIWGGEAWISVRRTLQEPPMRVALAAPVAPFTEPFREAARRNLWILAVVTVAGLFLAVLLTRRVTQDLVRLAEAAEAVSKGDLHRRVEATSQDEVGRVGRAFNVMTESLQQTLRKLSQRQALAAVGEFAAGLAHEVRNPLTSVRVDMQRIQEELPEGSRTQTLVQRALGEIDRVNRSVTGALRVARSGSVTLDTIDLRRPLEGAAHAAIPEFEKRQVGLARDGVPGGPVWVKGDSVALEQLILNLLLNAAQASEEGTTVSLAVGSTSGWTTVEVQDPGRGIPPEELHRIIEPFYSTRPEGTGLGLAIARRIAQAHGKELEFESTPSVGTTVRLHLAGAPPPLETQRNALSQPS